MSIPPGFHVNRQRFAHIALTAFLLFVSVYPFAANPAQAEKQADVTVGTGTLASCTEPAFDSALALLSPSGGTIRFNCGGTATILFTSVKIVSNTDTVIDGGGVIHLSGGNTVRPFYVEATASLTLREITVSNGFDNTYGGGAILSLGRLTLESATVRNNAVDSRFSGGAIMSLGPVTITDSLIENNEGGSVGGLYLFGEQADAVVAGSIFRNNRTTNGTYGLGGAITTWDGADLFVSQTLFEQNAARYGGAIYNQSASTEIHVDGSKIERNRASDQGGGAYFANGAAFITSTLFISNTANSSGGGINNEGGPLRLTNSAFRGNYGDSAGGVRNRGGTASISATTFQDNYSVTFGGGIHSWDNARASITNTTFSNNFAGGAGGSVANTFSLMSLTNVTITDQQNRALYHRGTATFTISFLGVVLVGSNNCSLADSPAASIISLGYNISSDGTCPFFSNFDRIYTPALLGPLSDNGGIGRTHMPLPGSRAIDGGRCLAEVPSDQRGRPRPSGAACDIGAVERQPEDDALALTQRVRLPLVVR